MSNYPSPFGPPQRTSRAVRRDKAGTGLLATFGVGFIFLWIAGALLSLGVTGVVIWALVRLVLHFT